MDQQQLSTALETEYLHLQKTIEDFDGKAITIKAWSVTFGLTVLVGAFASHTSLVFLLAGIGSILFWFLETMWKAFQLGYYQRTEQIESHFRGEIKLKAPYQIGTAWMEKWNNTPWSEVAQMALWPHIALPHAVVVVLGLGLFGMSKLGLVVP
jgi:hypothetical protein